MHISSTQRFYRIVFILSTLSIFMRCGSNGSSDQNVSQTQRIGKSNASIDAKYIDTSSSLSSDGQKIIFTSGRDGNGSSKIYKSALSSGAWSTPVKLSSSSGLSYESLSIISPNGSWALIQGKSSSTNNSSSALVLCAYDTGNCVSVSTSTWGSGKFGFSSDSTLFYFLGDDSSSTGSKTVAGTLYLGTASTTPTPTKIATSNTILDAFWNPMSASNYSLTYSLGTSSTGQKTISTLSFASVAAASTATSTNLSTTVSNGTSFNLESLSSSRFTLMTPIKTNSGLTFTELGNFDPGAKKTILARNQLHTWTYAGVDEGTYAIGFETTFSKLTSDDSSILTLNRIAIRCTGDADSLWGFSMAWVNRSDKSVTWKHLKIPTDLGSVPAFEADPCNRTLGNTQTTFDLNISEIQVNSTATASNNTISWTSDMTKDPEIFTAITTNGVTTVYNVSKNRTP